MSTETAGLWHTCTPLCRPPRHLAPSTDLAALAIPCPCGATAWHLAYGGPLPAMLVCGQCLRGLPLESWIRSAGRRRGGD